MQFIRQSPYKFGLMVWLMFVTIYVTTFVLTIPLYWFIDVLIAMNAAAFTIYGVDKLFAVGHQFRIPERVLWFSAFMGGPFGAALGMQLFRHKVKKGSFKFWLAMTVLLEIAIIVLILQKFEVSIGS